MHASRGISGSIRIGDENKNSSTTEVATTPQQQLLRQRQRQLLQLLVCVSVSLESILAEVVMMSERGCCILRLSISSSMMSFFFNESSSSSSTTTMDPTIFSRRIGISTMSHEKRKCSKVMLDVSHLKASDWVWSSKNHANTIHIIPIEYVGIMVPTHDTSVILLFTEK